MPQSRFVEDGVGIAVTSASQDYTAGFKAAIAGEAIPDGASDDFVRGHLIGTAVRESE